VASQNLVAFIRDSLNRGADLNIVRQQLLQQGHSVYEVDDALNFVLGHPQEVRHTIGFSKSALVAVLAVVLGVVLSSYLILQYTNATPPAKLLDFETLPVKAAVKAGEILTFQVSLFNMGNTKRYDVTVTSEVVNEGNKLVARKQDTFAVEKRTTQVMQIEIPPSTLPGTYYVRSKANYSKAQALSTFTFRVYKESAKATCFDNLQNQAEEGIDCGGPCKACPSCSDHIKNQAETGIDCGGPCKQDCCLNSYKDSNEEATDCGGPCKSCSACGSCDDSNACTEDSCLQGKCLHVQQTPCCGDGYCDHGETTDSCSLDCKPVLPTQNVSEIIRKAVGAGATNPESAVQVCTSLRDSYERDRCLTQLAESTNQSLACDSISSSAKRDACLMRFALAGDYAVCEDVTDNYLKKSCESLKYMRESS
jgi:hypothetical protein